MLIVLASLGMFFFAAILAYVVIRVRFSHTSGPPFALPGSVFVSTMLLMSGSFVLHRAMQHVLHERQRKFKRALLVAAALGVGFVVVQSIGVVELLTKHYAVRGEEPRLYGLICLLAGVHVLHFVGGMVALLIVLRNAFRGRYDHEYFLGVRMCVIYWHFLDVVWLVMLAVFWGMG